jgi:hypothetical protein
MSRRSFLVSIISCALLCTLVVPSSAADAKKREAVARLVTASGTVVAREEREKPWKVLVKDQDVFSGDLLIGLAGAIIESKNGAVRLMTHPDLSNRSPLPIIESAVRLLSGKNGDLELALDRGRIDLTNIKAQGSAKVRVHFQKRYWDLTLEKPGTRLTMEIYGRWPRGTQFTTKPKPGDGPVTSVLLIVVKGEVLRSCPLNSVAMTAPPGPAQVGWDSIYGDDRTASRLDALPDWLAELDPNSPQAKLSLERREKFRKLLVAHGLGEAILSLLHSPEPEVRRVGVYALGAFDQLYSLADVLARSKDAETWNNAVIAMRHWLGREPGQDQLLYHGLQERGRNSPKHAQIILQMLMGFTEEEMASPALYSVLIDFLKHEKLPIRGLAYWHLQRMAPDVKVAYSPIADKKDREKAAAEYREALRSGKLLPELKQPEEKK